MAFGQDGRFYEVPEELGFKPVYAGRTDILTGIQGEWSGVEFDGVYLGDYKTGKKPASNAGYPEWPLQLALYSNGIEKTYGDKVDGEIIFHLDKFTGIPTVYDYSDNHARHLESGQRLVDFYHSFKSATIERNGGIPSVTTILKVLDKPALPPWAANCVKDYVIAKMQTRPSIGRIELFELLEEARKNYRSVSSTAMDVGTRVHDLIEQYLTQGKEPTKRELFNKEVKAAWDAFMDMWSTLTTEVIRVEAKIYG
jgi:hypothetical protein